MQLAAVPAFPVGYRLFRMAMRDGYRPAVLLDGKDITRDCVFADDLARTAYCFQRDSDGRLVREGGKLVIETRKGYVRFLFPLRADACRPN